MAVRFLLQRHQLRPDRRLGQHFLVDDGVYDDIVATAQLSPEETVLEIGPGLGTLTERLAAAAGRVVAVELDRRLTEVLRLRLRGYRNVRVVAGDILASSVMGFGLRAPYKVVANIPYQITGAILKKFLADDVRPRAMTLLVQREVGERIVAGPGDMTLLALSVQLYAEPEIVRVVPASCFLPPPAVDSVLLQVARVRTFPFADVPEKLYWRVARIGFSSKRKQLKNNLVAGLRCSPGEATRALAASGVADRARAEDLSAADWLNLAVALKPNLVP